MINSNVALVVLSCLALILALVIPVLNSIPKLSNFISLRWSCVAIILLIMVGVVIDFSHLADTTRDIIFKGGIIIVGLFIVVRTIEKILYNGWLKGVNLKGSIQRGDTVGKIEISNQQKEETKKEDLKKEKEESETSVKNSDS